MRPIIFALGLVLLGIGLTWMLYGYSLVLEPGLNPLGVTAREAVLAGSQNEIEGGLVFAIGLGVSGFGAASKSKPRAT